LRREEEAADRGWGAIRLLDAGFKAFGWRSLRISWPGCCETILRLGLERVKATMNREKNNVQVNLITRIPVLIVYGTATVNEENQIRFFDDVYGYDAELDKALAAGYPRSW
jgi:hypothetical protein